ncbi:MAG: O-antigen ligase family protein [Cytophagales bacterium]|nr:O-antigen ligase family protein [Cytophagales bacterium]
MKLRINDLFVYFLLCPSLILIFIFKLNYIIYAIPIFSVLIYILNYYIIKDSVIAPNKLIYTNEFIALLIYIILVLISTALNIKNDIYFKSYFRDILIILFSLMVGMLNMRPNHIHIKVIFLVLTFCYFFSIGFSINFKTINSLLIADQNNSNEFTVGFIFGIFVLYFLRSKDWLFLTLSLIISLLASKRVTYLGLIVGLVYIYTIHKPILQKLSSKALSVILLGGTYISLLFVGYFMVEIADIFLELSELDSKISINHVLSSREVFIKILQTKIQNADILKFFFGHGPGQADRYLQLHLDPARYDVSELGNPHNDFIKIIFDYGWVGAMLFIGVIFTLFIHNINYVESYIYTMAIFLVDNSFVVIYYIIIAVLIAQRFDRNEKNIS